jgi:hypothetical protein
MEKRSIEQMAGRAGRTDGKEIIWSRWQEDLVEEKKHENS